MKNLYMLIIPIMLVLALTFGCNEYSQDRYDYYGDVESYSLVKKGNIYYSVIKTPTGRLDYNVLTSESEEEAIKMLHIRANAWKQGTILRKKREAEVDLPYVTIFDGTKVKH